MIGQTNKQANRHPNRVYNYRFEIFSIYFQFQETHTYDFNCAKLESRKSGIGQFCAKWLLRIIAQIAVFSRKTDAQRKKNFAFLSAKIAQKFCEWKPYAGHSLYRVTWHFQLKCFLFLKCTKKPQNKWTQNLL